jgi:predicted transcriptional regulator
MVAASKTAPYRPPMIIPEQIRAARAMLGWRQRDLAAKSGVSAIGIKNIETGQVDPRLSTVAAIERAFAEAGIMFIDENSAGGPGVRFTKGRR